MTLAGKCFCIIFLVLILWPNYSNGHSLRFGTITITQEKISGHGPIADTGGKSGGDAPVNPEIHSVVFRLSTGNYDNEHSRLVFPPECKFIQPAERVIDVKGLVVTGQMVCVPGALSHGLVGLGRIEPGIQIVLRLVGQPAFTGTYVLNNQRPAIDLSLENHQVLGDVQQKVGYSPHQSDLHTLGVFCGLGIEHILSGTDHLLFILGMVFLIGRISVIIRALTAFTAGHSLSLFSKILGGFDLPPEPVEASIALSILFLAVEMVRLNRIPGSRAGRRRSLFLRRPFLLALIFGLLHGLGFAGALAETGFPQNALWAVLTGFNMGVELGQILFVGTLLVLYQLINFISKKYGELGLEMHWHVAVVPAAYLVGILSAYWLIERTVTIIF